MRALTSTILAFLTAPVPISVTFAISSVLGGIAQGTSFVGLFVFAGIFYVYAIVFTLVLGAPLFAVLRAFNLVRWWSASLAGLLISVAVVFLVFQGNLLHFGWAIIPSVGTLSGLLFWSIWRTGHQHATA